MPWRFATAIDPGVGCLAYAGWTLWLLGYPDQALERSNQALTLAQTWSSPYTLARGLYWTLSCISCAGSGRWSPSAPKR